MGRRSLFGLVAALAAVLLLAAPALAGGWAVITLDALPRDVRAGQSVRVGFSIRQHGSELVNTDWEGHALKPVLTARKQANTSGSMGGTLILVAAHGSAQAKGETIQVEARQEGPKGHFVADVVFPSAGTWAWEIAAPPFTIQGREHGDPAVFEPLVVVLAVAAPAPAAGAQTAEAAEPFLGIGPAGLRWAGLVLLIVAVGLALAAQRGSILRRRAAQPQ
jgi:hypothetical protein